MAFGRMLINKRRDNHTFSRPGGPDDADPVFSLKQPGRAFEGFPIMRK